MTKQQVLREFKAYTRGQFNRPDGSVDKDARVEAWNNYTDALCKDGQITDRQYSTWVNPF